MRHVVLRDLSLCPVDADQTVAWPDEEARQAYLSAQQARYRANSGDPLARAIYSICLTIDHNRGGITPAGTCWHDYRADLRRQPEPLSWSRSLAFTMAWTTVRFMAQYGTRQAQQIINRSTVPDGVMINLRARTLEVPTGWADALRQVVTSTVVALLETPEGEGAITKGAVYEACVLALQENDRPSSEHIRRVISRYIDAIWEELTPA